MFRIQIKPSPYGKWQYLRFGGTHSHIESAIQAACNLDQDGLFTSDVRIVNDIGNVVVKGDNKFHGQQRD